MIFLYINLYIIYYLLFIIKKIYKYKIGYIFNKNES